MKKNLLSLLIFFLLVLGGSQQASAQDLVYEPKNPAFGGGNSFNYSWLLSSATAQDKTGDKDATTSFTRDPLANFEQSLNQQILSELSRRLVGDQFGEDGIQEGSYTIGSYQIEVAPGSGGISIQITDANTGNQTTVTIPTL